MKSLRPKHGIFRRIPVFFLGLSHLWNLERHKEYFYYGWDYDKFHKRELPRDESIPYTDRLVFWPPGWTGRGFGLRFQNVSRYAKPDVGPTLAPHQVNVVVVRLDGLGAVYKWSGLLKS